MDSNQIQISVIIPVYNAEKTLRRCVDSLLSQQFSDAEIILVNDGSTDGSGALCRQYANTDPRVRVIEKENGGVSSARNAGLDVAQGHLITFADSDDYVSPLYFDEILRQSDRWDLVRFSWRQDDGERFYDWCAAAFSAESRREALPQLINDICNKSLNSPVTKVYQKEILDQYAIRFPVGVSMAEDRAFNISYSLHVHRYLVCSPIIYTANTENGASLSRRRHEDLEAQFRIVDEYVERAIDSSDIPGEEKEMYRRAVNFGKCRSIYREAKDLHRDGIGWLGRQKYLWRRCRQINSRRMRYPSSRFCRLITLPVRLRLTVAIDLIAWRLLRR